MASKEVIKLTFDSLLSSWVLDDDMCTCPDLQGDTAEEELYITERCKLIAVIRDTLLDLRKRAEAEDV